MRLAQQIAGEGGKPLSDALVEVVAAISAFNHPLNLIVHQVIPAVAVGCPVIVKPASATPLSCFDLVDLLHKAGVPPDWCQTFLPEEKGLAEALVTDPRVAFLSFIGTRGLGPPVQVAAGYEMCVGAIRAANGLPMAVQSSIFTENLRVARCASIAALSA